MKYQKIIILFLACMIVGFVQTACRATESAQVMYNGSSDSLYDIVFIPYGYSNMQDFRDDVTKNADRLFGGRTVKGTNFFTKYLKYFNVWRIDQNASGSSVADINNMAACVPGADCKVLIQNTYAGQEHTTGTPGNCYVWLLRNSGDYYVLAHELGNTVGKLGDEYAGGGCANLAKFFPNIHDHGSNEKWSALFGTPPYEGARGCSTMLWRPYYSSVMRDSAGGDVLQSPDSEPREKGYCPVGEYAMVLEVGKVLGYFSAAPPLVSVRGIENYETVKNTVEVQVDAAAHGGTSIDRVEFYWAKSGETSRSMKIDRSYPYSMTIDTRGYDNSSYYLDIVVYDTNWNYCRKTIFFNINNSDAALHDNDPSELDVEILCTEALTLDSGTQKDMPGRDRQNEPLTVGIPLPEDSGITESDQLGLADAEVEQFRVLDRWPNGNIKWALVDTQVSMPANGQKILHLSTSPDTLPVSGLASEQGSVISVDTGVAQFTIRKSYFNFIDEAVVNGTEMVVGGHSGGLSSTSSKNYAYDLDGREHTLHDGQVYRSSLDPDSTAVIEENGPARACIKTTGALVDSAGNRLFDYTVRLHFYKDKSYVRTSVIMRHAAPEAPLSARTFSDFNITIPTSLSRQPWYIFSARDNTIDGIIDNTAGMYQAFSMDHRTPSIEQDVFDGTKSWYHPPMDRNDAQYDYVQKGLLVQNGATIINPLGDENQWTRGYAELKDGSGRGVTVAMQYMSGYWPASVEFTQGGRIEVGIFSKFNSKKDVVIGWGTHETRELMFDFHDNSIDNQMVLYRLEQPVVGRCELEHYRKTGALFGQRELVSAKDMEDWFLTNYGTLNYYTPRWEWHHINRGVLNWRVQWYSGVVGLDNPLCQLYTFLKTGLGGNYMASLQKTLFHTDSGVTRSDGFDFSKAGLGSVNETGAYNRGGGQNHFDYGHNHWLAMPLHYYITGNEEIRDAIIDYLEEFIRKGAIYINSGVSLRVFSRYYRTLAFGYEFTGDERLLQPLKEMTEWMLDSRDNPPDPQPLGRNLERGYFWGSPTFVEPAVFALHFAPIHIEDAWQGLRVFRTYDAAYARVEDLEDYLLGLSQFFYHEDYFENADGSDFGSVYHYWLHDVNGWIDGYEDDLFGKNANYMRKDDVSKAMSLSYRFTGDEKYIERGKKILAFGKGTGSATPFPAQELMYIDLYGVGETWRYVTNISSTHVGNGRYRLVFQVPDGALEYKIKYAGKPIVDWLGFDQKTRQYRYDPDRYVPYFAAINLDNEPDPLAGGRMQTVEIDIVQAINEYNSSRGLTPENPSYVAYDPGTIYNFAVKCLVDNGN